MLGLHCKNGGSCHSASEGRTDGRTNGRTDRVGGGRAGGFWPRRVGPRPPSLSCSRASAPPFFLGESVPSRTKRGSEDQTTGPPTAAISNPPNPCRSLLSDDPFSPPPSARSPGRAGLGTLPPLRSKRSDQSLRKQLKPNPSQPREPREQSCERLAPIRSDGGRRLGQALYLILAVEGGMGRGDGGGRVDSWDEASGVGLCLNCEGHEPTAADRTLNSTNDQPSSRVAAHARLTAQQGRREAGGVEWRVGGFGRSTW